MCKMLAELLGTTDPLFPLSIKQLERASGNPSVDVRLTAEIIGKVYRKMRELGLDPRDTTGAELYHALLGLVEKHDAFLAQRIGARDATDVKEILPRLKTFIEQLEFPKTAWVLKASTAKRLLRATPPKKVMKQLGYRSIDSMIKRESIGELFGALRFVESPEWLEKFVKKYEKLSASDFEVRTIEIIQLNPEKWGVSTESFVHHNRHNITHLKEFGVILILPLPVRHMPGITITVLPLLLHYMNEIRLYSAYFKLQQVKPHFGTTIAQTILTDPGDYVNMAGRSLHWRVVGRHFGKTDPSHHPEIFEPHVQPEDLQWRKAEDVLYRIEPALHFWYDMEFVGVRAGLRPISFNLMDMAVSHLNKLPYGQQTVHHMRESLWNELHARYIEQRALELQVLRQLDTTGIGYEMLPITIEGAIA